MTYLVWGGVIALVVFALLIIVVTLARQPYYHRNITLEEIPVYVSALWKRGYDRGFLVIEDMKSDKFVQFAKYIKEKGHIGIRLDFPRAPWSEPYYEKLRYFLRDHDIPFSTQSVETQPVTEFLHVDCGSDLQRACRIVEGIFRDVFDTSEPVFKVWGHNISAEDKLIDSKVNR
jgi:hypothetical protein